MAFRRFALSLIAAVAVGSVSTHGQVPGQNINMVTGKVFPGGDPWLQKQNEPSGAVSTVNPCRLLAGANDYRAVNVPGNVGDKEIGDAWVGWYTSINCGQTWYSTLMPGYPQDTSAAGMASPVKGLSTAADPTVRAGAGGLFAYSFIAFNRGSNVGKVAIARFLDRNTTEAVTKAETAIAYVDTKVWDTGSAGQYIDKPMVTVSQGTGTCTVAGKTIPASVIHLAWTVFVGNNDDVIRTKVYYARSSNCGATLDGPATKLSEGYAISQSASVAVAPNGAIYVVWRQFATPKGDLNQILVAKSVDGGKTFTKGAPVPITPAFVPFDQGTTSKSFRTNAYPAIAIDALGRLYVAVTVRGFASSNAQQARVVVTSTTDGIVWNMPEAVENSASQLTGHQIMPAITTAGGKLNLVWLDFRDDASKVFSQFDEFVREIYPLRHTMDVRGAQATPQANGSLAWTSYGILQEMRPTPTARRISRYITGDYVGETNELLNPKQLQYNRSNLKLYAGGTRPFIGDFIDVAGLAFLAQQDGLTTSWVPNDGTNAALNTTAAQTFYAFWTDNRDAKVGDAHPEPLADTAEGATLEYVAPGTTACLAAGPNPPTKTRNANVYMSRITPGLFVAAPTNSKPSIIKNNSALRVQRAFPVLIQNRTLEARTFRVTIMNQPPDAGTTGVATLQQVPYPFPTPVPAPLLSTDVIVPANSGTSRTVYVVSATKYPRIKVDVNEVGVATPLTGSTILNLDAQNADIENADIENADIENADIENQEIHNADIENADIENADIENADIENADIENADIENADIENADIENADIENADIENADIENADIENADIENADIENADIENGSLTDYTVEFKNDGNTATSYQVKMAVTGDTSPYLFQLIGRRVYRSPSALGCIPKQATTNQILFNVGLTAADLVPGPLPLPNDPSPKNTIVTVAPGERIKVTLRAWDKDVLTAGGPANDGIQPFCPMLSPNCPVITNMVTVTVGSVSSNTGSNTPPTETFTSTPEEVPFTAIVTNTNDSGPGSLRQAINTSNAHAGFIDTISFNIPGGGVHTITPLSPLPQITDAVVIDGRTQPGYAGTPLIELNGSSAGAGASGLSFAFLPPVLGECPPPGPEPIPCDPALEPAPGSTVRGLAINRFAGNGILILGNSNVIAGNYIGTDPAGTVDLGNGANGIQIIDGPDNIIGGGPAADRNIISGNSGEGVRIDGANATRNMVRGNYVGTSANGLADLGNSASGVYIRKAPGNSVIENLVSGNNGFAGVAICGGAACGGGPAGTQTNNAIGNLVQGNLIGVNATGNAALGNSQRGISIDGAPFTEVGGPIAGDRNVVSSTLNGPGIQIFGTGADDNLIRGNFIGTGMDGVTPLGNNGHGVLLVAGLNNIISGNEVDRTAPNTIMFNTGRGIELTGGTHEFRINRIDSNGGLGISGDETILNGPVLTGASLSAGVVQVAGTMSGPASTAFTIDLYKSNACDPSGFGEGNQWFGAFVATTNVDGVASFNIGFGGNVVLAGQLVTALATPGDHITTPATFATTTQFSNCEMAVPQGFTFSTPSEGGNGHVYEYVPTPGTWTAARDAAALRTFRSLNGHLVTITSAFENNIVSAFRFNNDLRGWIGLTDVAVEGTFQWITGEPLGYTNWWTANGEPNNLGGNEHYAEIYAAGVWNDQTLNSNGLNQGYVVEYEVNPFVPPSPVSYTFTGTVLSVDPALSDQFSTSMTLSGSFTFAPNTPGTYSGVSEAGFGNYLHGLTNLVMTVGTYTAQPPFGTNIFDGVQVANNWFELDRFVASGRLSGTNFNGFAPLGFVSLDDSSQTRFSDRLLTNVGDLTDWTLAPGRSGSWYIAFSASGASPRISGVITSITRVP